MRWSLRTMFVLVSVLCVLCGWFEYRRSIARRERDVAKKWASLGEENVEILFGPVELYQGPNGIADLRFRPRKPTRWERIEIEWFGSPHLSVIRLKHQCHISPDLIACLPDAVHLKNLGLPWSNVTPEDVEVISRLSTLERLDLAASKAIDDDALEHVTRLRDLRVLDVAGTGITDAALRHIGRLEKLEWLNIFQTQVRGQRFFYLVPLQNLRYLSSEWNYDREAILTLDECPKLHVPDFYGYIREKRAAATASSATTVDKLELQAAGDGDGHDDEQGSQSVPHAD